MKKNWVKRVAFLFTTVVITVVSFNLMAPPPPPPPPPPMPSDFKPQAVVPAEKPKPVAQTKPAANSGDTADRRNLLDEIVTGKKLKKVTTNDKNGPNISDTKQPRTNTPQGQTDASGDTSKSPTQQKPAGMLSELEQTLRRRSDTTSGVTDSKPNTGAQPTKSQNSISNDISAILTQRRSKIDPIDDQQLDNNDNWNTTPQTKQPQVAQKKPSSSTPQDDNLVALTVSLSILNSITKPAKSKPLVVPKQKSIPQSPNSPTNVKTPELSPVESSAPKSPDPTKRTPPTVLPKPTSPTNT